MPEKQSENSYWSGMASRYRALDAPLSISPSEIGIYTRLISTWRADEHAPRVLVMGATPGFFHLPWPDNTELLAVDQSAEMLSAVWPGSTEQALCQDWLHLDLATASRDIVLCDGGMSFFSVPDGLQQLAGNLARIMAPRALLIIRLYVDADYQESPAEIFQSLEHGTIRNASELKLMLWFALHSRKDQGVRLDEVWQCFNSAWPDQEEFAQRFSWPEAEWQSMQAYRGVSDVYYFPSAAELTETFRQADDSFVCEAEIIPGGPCHQHLRILALRRGG